MTEKLKKYALQIVLIIVWMSVMYRTPYYYFYSVYMSMGIAGIICLLLNDTGSQCKDKGRNLLALCISLMIVLANYRMVSSLPYQSGLGGLTDKLLYGMQFLFYCLLIIIGGCVTIWHIVYRLESVVTSFSQSRCEHKHKPMAVFWVASMILAVYYTILMFMAYYPGIMTSDSLNQMRQVISGDYNNLSPVYHTLIIRFCRWIGLSFWNDINAGVAVFSVVQIIIMSVCFAYVIVTLYEMGVSTKAVCAVAAVYVLVPCHYLYSFTMWKDVLFSCGVLALSVAVFRYIREIGRRTPNMCIFVIGSLAMCLFRHNGFYSYILYILIMLILLGIRERRYVILQASMVIILVLSFILSHPVLDRMGIGQLGSIGPLCIPAQQIARVIVDDCEMTSAQRELLERIVDTERVPEQYNSGLSDPIINMLYEKDPNYYMTHKGDYLSLYVQLGLSHPVEYLHAWIDQTCGYWNGGTDYWRWYRQVEENELGISSSILSTQFRAVLDTYEALYNGGSPLAIPFQLFVSIGLHTWIAIVVSWIGLKKRSKALVAAMVPALTVIAILMIVTPVWSEFRYAYPVFCVVPFAVAAMFTESEYLPIDEKADNNPGLQ